MSTRSEAIPASRTEPARAPDATALAQSTFSVSILVSAVRCLLTYIVLPFVAPLVGLSSTVGPAIGIPVGLVALGANGLSIRRFWRANHRLRVPMTFVHLGVIALLVVLLVVDVAELVG